MPGLRGLAGLLMLGALAACGGQEQTGSAVRVVDAAGCQQQRAELDRQSQRIAGRFGAPVDPVAPAAGFLNGLRQTGFGVLDILRRFAGDIATENRWIGWSIDAFDDLSLCRQAIATRIRNDLAAGRIDRSVASEAILVQRRAYAADLALLRATFGDVERNTAVYSAIYGDLAADNDGTAVTVAPYRPSAERGGGPSAEVTRAPAVKTVTAPGSLVATQSVSDGLAEAQEQLLSNVQRRDAIGDRVAVAEQTPPDFGLDFSALTLPARETRKT